MSPVARAWSAAWIAAWIGLSLSVGGAGGGFLGDGATAQTLSRALEAPSLAHPWGFDGLGRDLLATVLSASRASLAFAALSSSIILVVGISLGSAISFLSPRLRFGAERALDFLIAFPSILLAIFVQAILPGRASGLVAALAIGMMPTLVRFSLVRTRELENEEFVAAAKALGASAFQRFRRHYRPYLADLARVKGPFVFAQCLLLEATLSFLSIGVAPGKITWGSLLNHARDYFVEAPRLALWTGLPLVLTLLSLQALSGRER